MFLKLFLIMTLLTFQSVSCGKLKKTVRNLEEDVEWLKRSVEDNEKKIAKLILDNYYPDWIKHGESIYYVSTETLNWVDAEAFCETKGAMLVIVESQDEHEFIKQQLSTNGIDYAWTAGHDSITEGSWVWGDPEIKKIGQTFWNPHEPNSAGEEDCLEYRGGGWNDIACDGQIRFVCERTAIE